MAIEQQITQWVSPDGTISSTKEMAEQHEAFQDLMQELERSFGHNLRDVDSDQVINWIVDNRAKVQTLLDTSKAMKERHGL